MATDTADKTQQGTINVSTENIFPIIKKFLYSDHEIFLRELVANATDATQKLRTLSGMDKIKGELWHAGLVATDGGALHAYPQWILHRCANHA